MRLNNKSKAILIIALFIAVISVIVFLLIQSKNEVGEVSNKVTSFLETMEDDVEELEIPDVTKDNITIYASTIELTTDPVVVQAIPKLTHYKLYVYVQSILTDEERNNLSSSSISDTGPSKMAVDLSVIDSVNDSDFEVYTGKLSIERNSRIYFKYGLDGVLSKNSFEISIENIMKAEDVGIEKEEEITEEELEEKKVDTLEIKNSTSKYFIRVNYTANVVTIYEKNENGEYANPVKAMICSTGTSTPTSGTYKTSDKYIWRALVGNVYGKYATRIVGNILFHSVPYTAIDNGTLEWWEYDKLGTKASAGCVRLTVADAKWIYDNCTKNTLVEFYSDSNPGPLGKPTAQKISDNEECRNWDPTDYSVGNPWFNISNDGDGDTDIETEQTNSVMENTTVETDNETTNTSNDPTSTTVTIIPGNTQINENQNSTNENTTIDEENLSTIENTISNSTTSVDIIVGEN